MAPAVEHIPGSARRRLVAAMLCAVLCTPALATQKLTLCFENKMVEPWRTIEQTGLNFELLNRLSSRLQITFDYELLPWKRCLAKLMSNEVDGAFSVSYTDERRQYGAYPGMTIPDAKKRLHYARYFLIRKKGSAIDWDGTAFTQVNGKVAFQLGYSVGDMLRANKVAVDETNDSAHSVGRKVLAGRVAGAAMMDSDTAALLRGPLGPGLEVIDTPLNEKPYFLMLSHALVKTRPALAERIWKGVEEVRESKEYGKLVKAAGAENAR